jgi:plasmid stabilization system protein ParE
VPPVEFHPEAVRELDESFRWYEAQALGLGDEFLTEVDRAVSAVQRRPRTWPVFHGQIRRRLVHRFPYALIYEHDGSVIRVLAVMHLHRRPGYWRNRRS